MQTRLEMKSAPDNEKRRLDFECEFKVADGDAEGTIEGYGSVFDLLDEVGDIVQPGAFKKSLAAWRKRKALPPMLWQHDPFSPIGVWNEIAEDERGLKVKGRLVLDADVPQAKLAYALIKAGALKGLSIGFRTVDADIDRQTGARHLKQVELWEVSLVTFAALPEAQIASVKGTFNPEELEDSLREAGLSRRDAKTAVAVFRKNSPQRDAGDSERPLRDAAKGVLMDLRKATALFRS